MSSGDGALLANLSTMNLPLLLQGRRPTWAEVDLNQLEANFQALRRWLTAGVKIMAVIKADAYGHGAVPVARRLERAGADALAVAIPEEGLVLREAGLRCPLLVLNGFWPGQEEQIVKNNLTPVVFQAEKIDLLDQVAAQMQQRVSFHLKVNTGMSRLGVDWDGAGPLLEKASRTSWARCDGLLTHLSAAEDAESPSTGVQLRRFEEVLLKAEHLQIGTTWRHAANSAGLLNVRHSWFDGVRTGLALYGVNPLPEPLSKVALAPVLSLKTAVLQVRAVKRGQSIGYADAYTVQRRSLIATLPVGYADGLMRALSNCGPVLIRGRRAPIVGKISMDLTLIDVTDVPTVCEGDEVVLIGRQGDQEIRVEDLARLAQTIPYEILSRIGPRVPRVYIGDSPAGVLNHWK